MRQFRWPALGILLAIVLLVGTLLFVTDDDGPPGPPAPRPPENVPRVVVGLGDSTMSGEGAGDYDKGTDGENGDWCHRSPHASIKQVRLPNTQDTVNLACSGAPSAQVAFGDYRQYGEPSQALRLAALARTKRVVAVVVALGANDDPGFSHVLDGCIQAYFTPDKPGCGEATGPEWSKRVDAMVPKVVAALADVRAGMRNAGYADADYQLVVQSYAAPVGTTIADGLQDLSGCPLRSDDLRWIQETAVPVLTSGVKRAARQAGARLLDLSRSGVGHEACSSQDASTEWFRRVAVQWLDLRDDERAQHALQESFHPNAAGHAQFGRCLGEFLLTVDLAAACLPDAKGDLHPAGTPNVP